MPLFGPPNVEKMKARRDVKGLIKALGYKKDRHVRRAAASALGELKDTWAVEPLIGTLKDKDEDKDVRGATAETLGQIGDAQAVGPLIAALKDEGGNVRGAAAEALINIGAPAMEPLIVALKNSHYSNVRVGAAEALSKIGDERAVEPLVAALKDEDGGVRKAVAEALGQIGDVRAVEPLIAALKDVGVRKAAVEALVEIGAPAVKLLSTVLRDKDPNVRTVAAKSLEAIGWRPDKNEVGAAYWIIKGRWDQCVEIGAPAVEPLMAALQDNWEVVRKAAAEALGKIGDARAVKPLLTTLRDKNSGVRSATVIALDQVGWQPDKSKTSAIYWIIKGEWDQCAEIGAPAVEPLMAALQDNWEVVRKAAAEALRKIGPPAVKPLTAALKHGNAAAAEVLGQIGPPAVEPLIAALKDKDKDIREAAAVVLEKIGDTRALEPLADYWIAEYQWDRCVEIGTSAVEPLIAALKGKSTDVHEAAAEALVEIGAPAVEPLIATLKYKNLEVRVSTAQALVKMYRSGKLDDKAKQTILAQRATMQRLGHRDVAAGEHDDYKCYVYYHVDKECFGHHQDSAHTDEITKPHEDKSYGVDFPL